MDVTFNSLHEDIRILRTKLSTLTDEVLLDKSSLPAALRTAHYICQQCEASLQFLLSLCQQKSFRDRVLRNKVKSNNVQNSYFCSTSYVGPLWPGWIFFAQMMSELTYKQ